MLKPARGSEAACSEGSQGQRQPGQQQQRQEPGQPGQPQEPGQPQQRQVPQLHPALSQAACLKMLLQPSAFTSPSTKPSINSPSSHPNKGQSFQLQGISVALQCSISHQMHLQRRSNQLLSDRLGQLACRSCWQLWVQGSLAGKGQV